jgi:uncharacterized protein YdhG (YjbR/CyaY superfamily)
MKKTNAGKAISKTVDEYLEGVSEPGRTTLSKLLSAIRSVAPPETTEGIGYGMPTFKYKGVLVSFAAFKDHCSLFVGAQPIVEFRNELKNFKTSKGTIRFDPGQLLPAALLKKVLKARVAENQRKRGQ